MEFKRNQNFCVKILSPSKHKGFRAGLFKLDFMSRNFQIESNVKFSGQTYEIHVKLHDLDIYWSEHLISKIYFYTVLYSKNKVKLEKNDLD